MSHEIRQTVSDPKVYIGTKVYWMTPFGHVREMTPEFVIFSQESAISLCRASGIKFLTKWKDKVAMDRFLGKNADGNYVMLRVGLARKRITGFSETLLE